MRRYFLGFLLVFVATIFVAAGQILFKLASTTFSFSFEGLILNYLLWLGFISYLLGLIIFVAAIRFGELTILYPLLSFSYVWVLLFSFLFFNELFTAQKMTGLALLFVGILILGRSQVRGDH